MCVLRITSETQSLKAILGSMKMPVSSAFDAGEYRDRSKTRPCETNQATVGVSDKEWDDLHGQVEDAIDFLNRYAIELEEIFERIADVSAGLDFPINSILDDTWATQGINFPKELVSLAGKLDIDIGLTLYAKGLFDEDG